MTRIAIRQSRPGVTLLEVLISLFIMAIGLLSLLALFLTGAVSMGQSLQADRASAAALCASEAAEAMELRFDPIVTASFDTPLPGGSGGDWPVFVDPLGPNAPLGRSGPLLPGIARVRPAYAPTPATASRWFSLLDDITFGPDAKPAGAGILRGGRYTWSYLLRRPRKDRPDVVDLSVVVYAGRDTVSGTTEPVYTASGLTGEAGLRLTFTQAQGKPALRGGAWLMDITPENTGNRPRAVVHRVAAVAESGTNALELEVEPELQGDVQAVVVLESAIEVFRVGTGRTP